MMDDVERAIIAVRAAAAAGSYRAVASRSPIAVGDPPARCGHPFSDDRVAHIDCIDPIDLTGQVRDWHVEFAQLSPGPFEAAGLMIPLGHMLLGMVRFNRSLLHHGAPPEGCLSICIPGRGSDPFLFCGRELTEGQCVVLPSGSDTDAVSRGKYVGFMLSVGNDYLRAQAHWLGALETKGVQVHTPGTPWISKVLGGIRRIANTFARHPELRKHPEARASMEHLMLVHLGGATDAAPQRADHRLGPIHRHVAVERARTFIHDNLSRPLYLSDLCAHAHAQPRSLEYGFREIFGMSPVAYIKTMRLNRVRRLLRAADAANRTITEMALDCGFGHLSQFAADYRFFFGESPSDTRRANSR